MKDIKTIFKEYGITEGEEIKRKAEVYAGMAVLIARTFGEKQPKRHGNYWIYEDSKIRINYDDYGHNITIIDEHDSIVLSMQTGRIDKAFIGRWWTNRIEELWDKARLKQAIKDMAEVYNPEFIKQNLRIIELRRDAHGKD